MSTSIRAHRGVRAAIAALTVCAAAFLSAACGSGTPELPEVPDDAVALTENQPRRVDGLQLVASAIDADGANLSGTAGTAMATGDRADVGGTVEIAGRAVRLVATWVDDDASDVPGSNGSKVWVVLE